MLNSVEEKIKNIVLNFIDNKEIDLFVFGSRALGKAKKYSDYDIGIKSEKKIPLNIMTKIKIALEDSELPFKVDVVDFLNVRDEFKKEALKKIIKLD
jgi:predicted nucleotidyltransferase